MRPDWQVVVEISCKTSSVLFSVNNNAWQALKMSGWSQLGLSLVLDLVLIEDKPITPHFSTGLIKVHGFPMVRHYSSDNHHLPQKVSENLLVSGSSHLCIQS